MQPDLSRVETELLSLITGRRFGAEEPELDSLIVGDARAAAADRLAVYQHMYVARLVEVTEEQFPHLARVLGPVELESLVAAYLADEPSVNPSLRFLGARLPGWLVTHRPDAPRLAGLARLEWARADVYDVSDEPVLTMEELRAWPTEGFSSLPLRLIAAHRLLWVRAQTAHLWDVAGQPEASPPALADEGHRGEESVLVWRHELAVYHRLVDQTERVALELAVNGTSFGLVCDGLLSVLGEEQAVSTAFSWLSTWVTDGLIASPRG